MLDLILNVLRTGAPGTTPPASTGGTSAGSIGFTTVLFLKSDSDAAYCLCEDGVSEQVLQKAMDYASAAGADCSRISQNGSCYQLNTVKDHCNFAVISYYQNKSESGSTCDFSGAATLSSSPPSGTSSSNSFSSSSSLGTGASGTTPLASTSSTPTGSLGTSTRGTSTPGTSAPSTTVPGMTPGSTGSSPSVFYGAGLGPSRSSYGIADSSSSVEDLLRATNLAFTLAAFALPWLFSMLGW